MKKLRAILLIDDNEADNFLHEMVIDKLDCCEKVIAMTSTKSALEYLESCNNSENYLQPELIFLDINMPAMNGWEFIEAYKKIALHQKEKGIIVMLTTSLNPRDLEKVQEIDGVADFKTKPLDEKKLTAIFQKYFSE